MSQISPPIRIVLIAAIGLIAAWMFFLRPKTEEVPAPTPAPATAPGVTGLSNAVDGAKDAAAASEEANEKVQKATGEKGAAGSKPGKSGSEKDSVPQFVTGRELPLEPLTADQTKGLPKKLVAALDDRKVFAVGIFDTDEKRWARMASDDRAVRRELGKVNRYKGEVVVTQTSLGKLSKLNAVVGDAGVTQSPSVVIVDRNRKATVLNGFVEVNAINQAIADARRGSTEVRITDPFVRQLNRTCANLILRVDRLNAPTTKAGIAPAMRQFERLMASYSAAFVSLKGKSKYRPLAREAASTLASAERYGAALRSGNLAAIASTGAALRASDRGLNRKFADAGATSCDTSRLK